MGVVALAAALASAAGQGGELRSGRDYVAGPWGQIHVRVFAPAAPSGSVPLLLIHKMVWSSVQFERVQPLLAAHGVRSIAVDLPGYGLSDAPTAQPSADEYTDALLAVLAHYHLARVDLLGVDTGATLAVDFAIRHPSQTRRLILDGPPLFDKATAERLLQEPKFDRAAQPNGAEFSERVRAMQAGIPAGSLSDEAIHEGVLQFFQAGPDYLFAHHAVFSFDLHAALLKVRCPTLLLDSSGSLLHQAALQAHQLRPDFKYIELPFSGMMVSFDDPASWSAAVAKFVAPAP
jgi:pimeloyl-ACP methyl ester carboxylesterase